VKPPTKASIWQIEEERSRMCFRTPSCGKCRWMGMIMIVTRSVLLSSVLSQRLVLTEYYVVG